MELFRASRIWVESSPHHDPDCLKTDSEARRYSSDLYFYICLSHSFYKKQKQRKIDMQPFTGLENPKPNKI